MQQKTS